MAGSLLTLRIANQLGGPYQLSPQEVKFVEVVSAMQPDMRPGTTAAQLLVALVPHLLAEPELQGFRPMLLERAATIARGDPYGSVQLAALAADAGPDGRRSMLREAVAKYRDEIPRATAVADMAPFLAGEYDLVNDLIGMVRGYQNAAMVAYGLSALVPIADPVIRPALAAEAVAAARQDTSEEAQLRFAEAIVRMSGGLPSVVTVDEVRSFTGPARAVALAGLATRSPALMEEALAAAFQPVPRTGDRAGSPVCATAISILVQNDADALSPAHRHRIFEVFRTAREPRLDSTIVTLLRSGPAGDVVRCLRGCLSAGGSAGRRSVLADLQLLAPAVGRLGLAAEVSAAMRPALRWFP